MGRKATRLGSNAVDNDFEILELTTTLDKIRPGWRDDHLLLCDNTSAHKSVFSMRTTSELAIPIMHTAPASYACLAVERTFGFIKIKALAP